MRGPLVMLGGGAILAFGIFLLLVPISSFGTATDVNQVCNSALGTLGKAFSSQVSQGCQEAQYFAYLSYALMGIGTILFIIGIIIPSRKKEISLTCPYCNFVPASETDLLKHKAENHLDKSPFKCKECSFIGITKEILENHHKDNHTF